MAKSQASRVLIYSRQDSGFIKGVAYSNPRFYTSARPGFGKVIVVGDWPQIVADYQKMGVEVEVTDTAPVATPPPSAKPEGLTAPAMSDLDRTNIVIPEDWRTLKWVAAADQPTLRALAAQVSDVPVINKAGAVAAIEAELARRELQREVHADLEALGVEVDPAAPLDAKIALRDEARAKHNAGE